MPTSRWWLRRGIKSFRLLVMTEELDVLRIISERLRAADVPFMLTGSFALGYYGKPRMTRDLDFVVALMERHVDALVSAFSTDFYIDEDAARSAIKSQRMFNLMDESVDWPYLKDWAAKLGVAAKLDELSK
jgi:hypothetical protein